MSMLRMLPTYTILYQMYLNFCSPPCQIQPANQFFQRNPTLQQIIARVRQEPTKFERYKRKILLEKWNSCFFSISVFFFHLD